MGNFILGLIFIGISAILSSAIYLYHINNTRPLTFSFLNSALQGERNMGDSIGLKGRNRKSHIKLKDGLETDTKSNAQTAANERILDDECSGLKCHLCALSNNCMWCTKENCGYERCIGRSNAINWKDKITGCPANDVSVLCPLPQNAINDDFEYNVRIHHYNLSEGTFCKWRILNPNKYKLEVDVKKTVSSITTHRLLINYCLLLRRI